MEKLNLLVAGILLSALLVVLAYAGQSDVPAENPNKVKKQRAAGQSQVNQIKAGAQLNERAKRSELRDRSAAKRRQTINAGGGQQSQ